MLLNKKLGYPILFKTRKRIKYKNKKRSYYTVICSKVIVTDLIKLGLVPNKNRIMKMPRVPLKYLLSFAEGYFLGDGCLTKVCQKYKNRRYCYPLLKFTSNSKKFLDKFNNCLSSFLNILPGRLYRKSKDSDAYSLVYSSVPTRIITKSWDKKNKRFKIEKIS